MMVEVNWVGDSRNVSKGDIKQHQYSDFRLNKIKFKHISPGTGSDLQFMKNGSTPEMEGLKFRHKYLFGTLFCIF